MSTVTLCSALTPSRDDFGLKIVNWRSRHMADLKATARAVQCRDLRVEGRVAGKVVLGKPTLTLLIVTGGLSRFSVPTAARAETHPPQHHVASVDAGVSVVPAARSPGCATFARLLAATRCAQLQNAV